MSDYSELKRLAEAATIGDKPASTPIKELIGAQDAFRSECRPEKVLALIAESDNVTGQRDRYRALLDAAGYQWLDELLGYPVEVAARVGREAKRLTVNIQSDLDAIGKHAKSIIAERDQLKAENAGLMTGYEAYERVNAELKAESERIERNRDMWKGQVERQAEELTSLRKDAERYRRIKLDASMGGSLIERLDCNVPVKLWDSSIDREMAK